MISEVEASFGAVLGVAEASHGDADEVVAEIPVSCVSDTCNYGSAWFGLLSLHQILTMVCVWTGVKLVRPRLLR